ncbi:DinB family protein [Subtercola boreus]|uniref:Methyltransferase type 12 n=1 Tax=Subtercola boreus TaxID=120213 RepID=A0A3E0WG41_9MICO|nr:DinB family protein [Subtercola boreus]RFA23403.1 methyltransferase type 12 [Subtercola boreus]RFA23796.1 methyltransferase type 12 [Subtercola boreus]RFA29497.1 methyltransferase type 12 [Subtercola boreus]
MAIVPDTKNWTWVLERECPECGFDSSATAATDVPSLIRQNVVAWPAVLERSTVTERPDETTWSDLEYAAHVRDVFRIFRTRLGLMLEKDDPAFPDWDQDVTAIEDRYNEQDPATVRAELIEAGEAVARAFEAVPPGDWQRTGRRGDGSGFTVETLARYFIHDPVHHLHDVRG